MSKVVKLDDHRPHKSEYVACMSCGKDWVASIDASATGPYECPSCGEMAGEKVEPSNIGFFIRFTDVKTKKDKDARTLVLLNAQRMGL